ncbi:hypothetical protein ACO1K0_14570, partial [Staphylococcus aureus]
PTAVWLTPADVRSLRACFAAKAFTSASLIMRASVHDALRVNPLGDANASFTATAQPIDDQPIKKAGE